MRLVFSDEAWDPYLRWRGEPAVFDRLNDQLAQSAARRSTLQDRVLYRVRAAGGDQALETARCRFPS